MLTGLAIIDFKISAVHAVESVVNASDSEFTIAYSAENAASAVHYAIQANPDIFTLENILATIKESMNY